MLMKITEFLDEIVLWNWEDFRKYFGKIQRVLEREKK